MSRPFPLPPTTDDTTTAVDTIEASSHESFEVAIRRAAQRAVAEDPATTRVRLERQERTTGGAYVVTMRLCEAC